MHPFHHWFHHNHHHHHHGASGRHGHRGFAGFGGRHGFRGGSPEGDLDGLNRGRKLGSADLQLLLLALLAESPSHGYQLIKALEDRSHGYYSPSPGMVYPALTYLEDLGYASVEEQGTKKLYSITPEGLSQLDKQRTAVDALLEQLAWIGQRFEAMRRAMAQEGPGENPEDFDADAASGGRGRHRSGIPEVRSARRSLKSALIEKIDAPLGEQRRIAKILERAAAEIRDAGKTAQD